MPLLSIVSVVLNDRRGLKQTRLSLSEQSSDNFEWIVCDGASSDDTLEALGGSGVVADRVLPGPDQGIYDAMNKGCALARGTFVLFLNAGDTLSDSEVVARLEDSLASDKVTDVAMGDYNLVFASGRKLCRRSKEMAYLKYSLPTSHQAILYRRSSIGSRPYDVSFRVCGDYQLTASMFAAGKRFRTLGYAIAAFHTGGTSSQQHSLLAREAASIQREVDALVRTRQHSVSDDA